MKKKRNIRGLIVIGLFAAFLASKDVMAASFTFSFMTGAPAYGGVGYKDAKKTAMSVRARTGNLSTSRYINVWGGNSTGKALTYTIALSTLGPEMYPPFKNQGIQGNIYLWGNPSTIGASATGDFSFVGDSEDL